MSVTTDAVDALTFEPKTGRRAVYEAFHFERTGDLVRVWNESHGEHAAEEHVYAVELDEQDVPERCTCPAFEYHCDPGEMCKHGVAVALHRSQIEDLAIDAGTGDDTDGRVEPTRSEPADFGAGESGGVELL